MREGARRKSAIVPLRQLMDGLALGLFIPAARAVFLTLGGGIRGDLLFELSLLGLLTGLVGLRPAPWLPRWGRSVLPAFLLAVPPLAAAALPLIGRQEARWIMAGSAAACAFGFLHLFGKSFRARYGNTRLLGANLLSAAAGMALTAVLLPLLGPALLFATGLGALVAGGNLVRPGRRRTLVAVWALLAAAALLDLPQLRREAAERLDWESPVTRRVWYPDGVATLAHQGRRWMRTSVAGEGLGWVTPRRWESVRGGRALPTASAELADDLVPSGRVLLMGPATGASWLHLPVRTRETTLLLEDGRLSWWYRDSLPDTGKPKRTETDLAVEGPRSFLAGRGGRFDLIYHVDPHGPDELRSGAAGRRPAWHLTLEAVKTYLDALSEEGFLILEVPYSLKLVSMLREIGSRDSFPVEGNLLIAGDPETGKDIVVFRKSPLEPALVERLAAILAARGKPIHYRPGDRLMINPLVRLVWARHPRWYYASGTDEFSPPADDRPFFYQVQKLIPRTRSEEVVGLTPQQAGRLLGIFPEVQLPWMILGALSLGAGLTLFTRRFRRRGNGAFAPSAWRYRFFVFFLLFGVGLELCGLAGIMILGRGCLKGFLALPVGGALLLAGLSSAWWVGGDRNGEISPWLAWVLLPAALLPMAADLAGDAPGWPLRMLLTAACLLPLAVCAGRALRAALTSSGEHNSFPAGACLGYLGLGVLLGRELAVPLAQTFSLSFTLVLGWVALYISLRLYRRIPAIAAPGRD